VLWTELGYKSEHGELLDVGWPQPDPQALKRETVEIVVQVNGKLRGRVSVPAQAGEDRVRELALADEAVARHVGGKPVKKVIVVPGKLVNIVL
jgi:leucyl-tRNA synthetase